MERKSYRSAGNAPEKKSYAAPKKQEESKFIYITGFFPSKSGKADTVFLTEEIVAKLHECKAGDTLGISEQKKTGRIGLWYVPNEGE